MPSPSATPVAAAICAAHLVVSSFILAADSVSPQIKLMTQCLAMLVVVLGATISALDTIDRHTRLRRTR